MEKKPATKKSDTSAPRPDVKPLDLPAKKPFKAKILDQTDSLQEHGFVITGGGTPSVEKRLEAMLAKADAAAAMAMGKKREEDAVINVLHAPQGKRDKYGKFVPASFQFTVHPHDIRGGVEQLIENGREDSWMVFLFDTLKVSELTDDRGLALQYSVINRRIGLDWVLIGPRNIADRESLETFMTQRGHTVELQDMNFVQFLRVEDGDLAALGESILDVFYGVPATAQLGLLIDGLYLSTGVRTRA